MQIRKMQRKSSLHRHQIMDIRILPLKETTMTTLNSPFQLEGLMGTSGQHQLLHGPQAFLNITLYFN